MKTKAGKKRKRAPRKNEGRPEIKFDEKKWQEFEQLCGLQCTKIEITEWFGIDDKTLDNLLKAKYKMSFSEVFLKKRSKGFTSLRRSNFKMAQINASMAKFLSTNYLGLKDKLDVDISGSILDKLRKLSKEGLIARDKELTEQIKKESKK